MELRTPNLPADLEVLPAAPEQAGIVANLLQLYAHDFSEFHDVELGGDGRFAYPDLPLYWSDPTRYALLFRVHDHWAGFAFVKRATGIDEADCVWDMAEFFILRRYRRSGQGTSAARQIWKRFPGRWQVRVLESNHVAHRFWTRAIGTAFKPTVAPVKVEVDGHRWSVFSFDTG